MPVRGKHLSVCPLLGGLLDSPTKIGLGCKSSSGANRLAYREKGKNTDVKSFIKMDLVEDY